ncbi:MAG: dephospho-CoA kinase [Candidatus Hydrogenedentes bacterium]|nr:dephospho-CoA kinase [Candidatus Hydrogenedentota bacterium]
MRIYGLTGGTGSGKSEAGRMFRERGLPVLDADAIGHELVEPGGAAVGRVIEAFGNGILTDGHINREKLGALVFRDAEARQKLNAIIHPEIRQEIARRCGELIQDGHEIILIDAALIAENGQLDEFMAGLIVVTCPEEIRVKRLVQHRGITEDEARRRIAAQTPPEKKIPLADWVIENSGTIEVLEAQVDRVSEELQGHGG